MKFKNWIAKCAMLAVLAVAITSTSISASAVQRNRDDRRADSRELKRDYERLRVVDRKIDRERKEMRQAEKRHDWNRVRRHKDEIAKLLSRRAEIEREIIRDKRDRDHRPGGRP